MIPRYENKLINQLFSDEQKYKNWLEIELLVLEYYSKIKKISVSDFEYLKKNLKIDINKINEIELKTRHDVIAFVDSLNECVNNDLKKWIHFGLTSTDIVDTGNAITFKKVNKIILNSINELMKTIKKLALKHKQTFMIGRTHGIHAEITTFGLKMALWFDEMERNKKRFISASKEIEVGKISGAVGTFANTGDKMQDYVCKKLQINSANISTQIIQRDIHANYFNTLNLIGLSINKFATELRHMSRTEINEVNEYFSSSQKGSSAMPHKKNPITCENICGLSRLLNGYSLTINENVNLWNERDISHSSNERVVYLDATTIVVNILDKLNNVLKNLFVNKQKMLENISLTNNIIFSQTLLLKLIETNKFNSRDEVYRIVQSLSFSAMETKTDFKKIILNSQIKDYLTENEINKLFDKHYHIKYIDNIYNRVFKNGK